jgi:hypothetical protein
MSAKFCSICKDKCKARKYKINIYEMPHIYVNIPLILCLDNEHKKV